MGRRVAVALHEGLAQPGVRRTVLLHDAGAMRARLAAELPPQGPWDVKLRRGGLMEVEFIAQILQLAAGNAGPGLGHPTTRVALRRLAGRGLMSGPDARRLIEADRFWRAIQSLLRILFGTRLPRTLDGVAPPALEALLHGVVASCPAGSDLDRDLAGLERRMARTSVGVRAIFCRLIGDPDAMVVAGDLGLSGPVDAFTIE